MQQPIPQFGAIYEDRGAAVRGTLADARRPDDGLPAQVVSSGMPFLFVAAAKSLEAMRRIRLRLDLYEQTIIKAVDARGIFVFTPDVELRRHRRVHARMFAPQMGIAKTRRPVRHAGPLGAYLLRYGLVDAATAEHMIGEQGFEMKRPSLLHVHLGGSAGQITEVSVGGYCQRIGRGR